MSEAFFDYDLPPGLIAQEPAGRRDQSRLLVVNRTSRVLSHRRFFELPELLAAASSTASSRPLRFADEVAS